MVLFDDEHVAADPPRGGKHLALVALNGGQVGQRFVLRDSRLSIGRDASNDIILEDEGVSRTHAVLERSNGGYRIIDTSSTNGIFVNGTRTVGANLSPGDRIGLGAETILKLQLEDDLGAELESRIFAAAVRDGLTGAFNRAAFDQELQAETARALRHETPLSLLLFDLDHFKGVNDTYGHLAGDEVLREMVARLRAVTRSEDSLSRFGGEEFVLLCAGTSRTEAAVLAARARDAIRCEPFRVGDDHVPVTTSIGVAELLQLDEPTPTALLGAVDAALYRAKANGRDRVEIHGAAEVRAEA